MSEKQPTEIDIEGADLVYSYSTGPGWEYKEAEFYAHSSGRFILKEVSQHIDSESGPNTYYSWINKDEADKKITLYRQLEQQSDLPPSVILKNFTSLIGCMALMALLGALVSTIVYFAVEKYERVMEQVEKGK